METSETLNWLSLIEKYDREIFTLLGVFLGGVISLVGSIISNHMQTRNLKMTFANERDILEVDQRKKILYECIESAQKMGSLISFNLQEVTLDEKNEGDRRRINNVIHEWNELKVHLVTNSSLINEKIVVPINNSVTKCEELISQFIVVFVEKSSEDLKVFYSEETLPLTSEEIANILKLLSSEYVKLVNILLSEYKKSNSLLRELNLN